MSRTTDLWIHCYQQGIRYLIICDLTICNLTALTLPLLPYCHYLTVVAPWRCLFLSGSTDLWIHCYQQWICYLTSCNLTMPFLKSGVCFFLWIFRYCYQQRIWLHYFHGSMLLNFYPNLNLDSVRATQFQWHSALHKMTGSLLNQKIMLWV